MLLHMVPAALEIDFLEHAIARLQGSRRVAHASKTDSLHEGDRNRCRVCIRLESDRAVVGWLTSAWHDDIWSELDRTQPSPAEDTEPPPSYLRGTAPSPQTRRASVRPRHRRPTALRALLSRRLRTEAASASSLAPSRRTQPQFPTCASRRCAGMREPRQPALAPGLRWPFFPAIAMARRVLSQMFHAKATECGVDVDCRGGCWCDVGKRRRRRRQDKDVAGTTPYSSECPISTCTARELGGKRRRCFERSIRPAGHEPSSRSRLVDNHLPTLAKLAQWVYRTRDSYTCRRTSAPHR